MSKNIPTTQWAAERSRILTKIMQRLLAIQASGKPVRRAARQVAARWNGRPYKSCPQRRLKLAYSTLTRILADYRRDPATALQLKYKPGRKCELPKAVKTVFVNSLANGTTASVAEARRYALAIQGEKEAPCGGYHTFNRLLTPRQKSAVRGTFAARVNVRRAFRRANASKS
jgi:hypothetical protein